MRTKIMVEFPDGTPGHTVRRLGREIGTHVEENYDHGLTAPGSERAVKVWVIMSGSPEEMARLPGDG